MEGKGRQWKWEFESTLRNPTYTLVIAFRHGSGTLQWSSLGQHYIQYVKIAVGPTSHSLTQVHIRIIIAGVYRYVIVHPAELNVTSVAVYGGK